MRAFWGFLKNRCLTPDECISLFNYLTWKLYISKKHWISLTLEAISTNGENISAQGPLIWYNTIKRQWSRKHNIPIFHACSPHDLMSQTQSIIAFREFRENKAHLFVYYLQVNSMATQFASKLIQHIFEESDFRKNSFRFLSELTF